METKYAVPTSTQERVRLLVTVLECIEQGQTLGHDVSALQAWGRALIDADKEVAA